MQCFLVGGEFVDYLEDDGHVGFEGVAYDVRVVLSFGHGGETRWCCWMKKGAYHGERGIVLSKSAEQRALEYRK